MHLLSAQQSLCCKLEVQREMDPGLVAATPSRGWGRTSGGLQSCPQHYSERGISLIGFVLFSINSFLYLCIPHRLFSQEAISHCNPLATIFALYDGTPSTSIPVPSTMALSNRELLLFPRVLQETKASI